MFLVICTYFTPSISQLLYLFLQELVNHGGYLIYWRTVPKHIKYAKIATHQNCIFLYLFLQLSLFLGGRSFWTVFGTHVNTWFPYFFYRILDFKGVRFFIYSLIKCNNTYLSFKIWDLLGVKQKNTSIFCYFDFIFNQKYIRVMYVFYDFYV